MVKGGIVHRFRRAAPLEGLLFRSGRYLHRSPGRFPPVRPVRFSLPPGVERVGATGFVIELEKITTYAGFSFAPGGWHPFAELIREYQGDPTLRYEDSVLCRLYERFTPATLQDVLFDDEEPLPPLDALPARRSLLRSLWALDPRQLALLRAQGPYEPRLDGDSRYFGPKSAAAGSWHFRKILDLYDSMREHGYDPVRFGGERPKGYLLVRDGDYRFVIGHANRRLAGIHAVGVRHVIATFFEHVPPVIDEAHLTRWATEQGGALPLPVLQRMFDQLFTSIGAERAERLGLR